MRCVYFYLTIIFIILMFSSLVVNAQKATSSISAIEENSRSFREFWVNIGGGPRILKTTSNLISTHYVDSSPSEDEFYGTLDIEDKYTCAGLNLEIGFGQKMGLSHTIFADMAFGQIHSTFSGYSVGWELPLRVGKSDFLVRPGFNLMYGNTGYQLGRMENTGLFIEIGNQKFYDDYLNVRLSENLLVYGPRLDLNFLWAKKYGMTASLAYDFAARSGKARAFFSAPHSADRPENAPSSTIIRLPDDRLNVHYNGRNFTQLPFDYGGWRLTLGLMLMKQL